MQTSRKTFGLVATERAKMYKILLALVPAFVYFEDFYSYLHAWTYCFDKPTSDLNTSFILTKHRAIIQLVKAPVYCHLPFECPGLSEIPVFAIDDKMRERNYSKNDTPPVEKLVNRGKTFTVTVATKTQEYTYFHILDTLFSLLVRLLPSSN